MIYETQIKYNNLIIEIEFDSEKETFTYEIKEKRSSYAKSKSTDKTGDTGTESRSESQPESTDRDSDRFLDEWLW